MDGRLDPGIAAVIEAFPGHAMSPHLLPPLRDRLPAVREAAGREGRSTDGVRHHDHLVDGTTGVRVRVHRPTDATGPRPCVFVVHAGGFVLGSFVMEDARIGRWCRELGCVGVSVDYRLAPETPFPGALDDCRAALAWVVARADRLGVDPTRMGVFGESAGGGLAAALALVTRDEGGPALSFQALVSPMLDDRLQTPSSRMAELAVWGRSDSEFAWRSYLGERYGTTDVPVLAAPARARDLTGLPPTLVCVGGADGFRDEAVDYATRLGHAGVSTELHVYAGAPHGIELFPGTRPTDNAVRDIDDWLAVHLATEAAARDAG